MTDQIFQTPAYKRSRWAYILECAFEYFVALMVADAFLATLLTELGLNDAVIGEGAELKYVILDKDVVVRPGQKLMGTAQKPLIIGRGEVV